MADRAAVPLEGEWLEAFWCGECQATNWYHVRKERDRNLYEISLAPDELWRQAVGVVSIEGNPSVGEFTRKQARRLTIDN
ncbi:MAG: hypothetical protein OHK0037_21320 [Elainellaceae cyanobacterium]